jgi:hypothetical protein
MEDKEKLNDDMQDFAITNDDSGIESNTKIDPLEELTNHNFSEDEDINLEDSYEMIQQLERISKDSKDNEAENIINELSNLYVNKSYKGKLDKSIENIQTFIKKYDVNSDLIKNITESEKTKYFTIGSFLTKNISTLINELNFSILLKREEYKMISSALSRKLTYDGNEVFNVIELNEKYLKKWALLEKSLPKQSESFVIDIDIKNVVMLYHFLQKHIVKGINAEFYIFANVLQKIADTNKLYNAYNIIKERIDTDFGIWVGAIETINKTEINVNK